jgi:hypothetical protein
MSKLNYYYDRPTISSTPKAGLVEINEVNNLKQKNKILWSGIIILFAITTSLFFYVAKQDDDKAKRQFNFS